MNVGHMQRIDQRDDRCIADLAGLVMRLDAQTYILHLALQPRLFKGFGGRSGGRCGFVHGPAFGNDPALAGAAGDQADLQLILLHAPAQGSKLRARIGFRTCPQFQRKLSDG